MVNRIYQYTGQRGIAEHQIYQLHVGLCSANEMGNKASEGDIQQLSGL